MDNKDEIVKCLENFINEKGIKGFSPDTIQQIAELNNGDLWNLVCNLIEIYYNKQ